MKALLLRVPMEISVLLEVCSNRGRDNQEFRLIGSNSIKMFFSESNQKHRQFLLLPRKHLRGHVREICRKLSTRSNLSFSG